MFMDCGLSTEKKQLGSAYQLYGFMCTGKRQQLDPSPQTCSCLQTHCLAKSLLLRFKDVFLIELFSL